MGRSRKAGSQASVEPCECVGIQERHNDDARSEDDGVLGLAQIEAAHTTDKQVADGEVEEAPQDIDHRRGQAYPRGGSEGALEGLPRNPVAEMGQGVREERAPEKVGHVVVPAHRRFSPECRADGSADGSKNQNTISRARRAIWAEKSVRRAERQSSARGIYAADFVALSARQQVSPLAVAALRARSK